MSDSNWASGLLGMGGARGKAGNAKTLKAIKLASPCGRRACRTVLRVGCGFGTPREGTEQ